MNDDLDAACTAHAFRNLPAHLLRESRADAKVLKAIIDEVEQKSAGLAQSRSQSTLGVFSMGVCELVETAEDWLDGLKRGRHGDRS